MTLEQITKAEPTKGYTSRNCAKSGPWKKEKFVDAVYTSLSKGGSR